MALTFASARNGADTASAFDGVADSYDESNARNPLLCAMRVRTRTALERWVRPGSSLLDLGCGPGTDEIYFGRRGYRVTAIDASAAMVAEARRRVHAAGLSDRVRVEHLGIEHLDLLGSREFDAAYSSFGPLNCVADLEGALRAVAALLRPGGTLVVSVVGRVCPWEIALYCARGNWARAALRFVRGPVAVPLEGRIVWTQYYSPRAFERAGVAAGFRRLSLSALGLFTPPPYLEAFAARHSTWIAALQRLDDGVGSWPLARDAGDHFLAVYRRES